MWLRTSQTSMCSYQSEFNKQPLLLFNIDLNNKIKSAAIQNHPNEKPPMNRSKQKLEFTDMSGLFIGVSERTQ